MGRRRRAPTPRSPLPRRPGRTAARGQAPLRSESMEALVGDLLPGEVLPLDQVALHRGPLGRGEPRAGDGLGRRLGRCSARRRRAAAPRGGRRSPTPRRSRFCSRCGGRELEQPLPDLRQRLPAPGRLISHAGSDAARSSTASTLVGSSRIPRCGASRWSRSPAPSERNVTPSPQVRNTNPASMCRPPAGASRSRQRSRVAGHSIGLPGAEARRRPRGDRSTAGP